jgi:hypothetical protein
MSATIIRFVFSDETNWKHEIAAPLKTFGDTKKKFLHEKSFFLTKKK